MCPNRAIDLVPESWGPKQYTEIADLALTRWKPDEISFEIDAHLLLVLLTPQPKREIRVGGSRSLVFDSPAGAVEVVPAGASLYARWEVPKENILISLDPGRVEHFAAREFNAGRVEMRPILPGLVDKTAAKLGSLIRDELAQAHRASGIYLESLATALTYHMVRSHSSLAERSSLDMFRGGLSPKVWRDVEAYIRENLAGEITLSDLSQLAGLSYSHFLRAFRQTTGVSPHRYIMLQRAQLAQQLTASAQLPLKQIAIQCGFASQSHMTTVMRSLLDITPGEIRRRMKRSGDEI